jgi:protein-disulfide isomerase
MKSKNYLILGTSVFLIFAFVLGGLLYKQVESNRLGFIAKKDFSTFVRDYSPFTGSPDATIYVVEFMDPECETCRAVYPDVKNFLREFDGKIKLVVRYAPFHPNSKLVIKILEASRKQDKYWETLELLFASQPEWGDHHNPNPQLIWDYLPRIGLDVDRIKQDMEDPKIAEIIEQDILDGKTLNVRQTPTFFVNGKSLPSFGMSQLRDLIASEIRLEGE